MPCRDYMENRQWQHITQYNDIIPIWTDWLTITDDHSSIAVKPWRNRLMWLPAAQTWGQPCISVIAMRLLSPFILSNCDFPVNCFMIHWLCLFLESYLWTYQKHVNNTLDVLLHLLHLLNLLFNLHCVALNWAGISLLQCDYLRLWPDTRILLFSDWHHHAILVPEHAGGPNRICSLHRNQSWYPGPLCW